jgi:hypothetical protein
MLYFSTSTKTDTKQNENRRDHNTGTISCNSSQDKANKIVTNNERIDTNKILKSIIRVRFRVREFKIKL